MTKQNTPARYRKRPVEIEAMLFDGTNGRAVSEWAGGRGRVREISEMHAPLVLAVYTLEGVMKASVGDWIIRGVKGELYPCKPDIFEATYEPAAVSSAAETSGAVPGAGDQA